MNISTDRKMLKIKKNYIKKKRKIKHYDKSFLIMLFLNIILVFIIIIIILGKKIVGNKIEKLFNIDINKEENSQKENIVYIEKENKIIDFSYLELFDYHILREIESKISNDVFMPLNEQKFLNGIVRKVKPKKIVEIGVARGGTSAIILNAIQDIEGAHLYSIEKLIKLTYDSNREAGILVKDKFQHLMGKWTFYAGGITAEFIEKIGGDIDLVFLDTAHYTPGEMLDWLQILPFLKEEAILVLHDTFLMYYLGKIDKKKLNYSNNQLFCYIRGDLIVPNYTSKDFDRNIGAIKLEKNQKRYFIQYFLALGTQWEYMPEIKDIDIIKKFFMKYYGERYTKIFEEAVEKNKIHLNINY